MHKPSAWKMRVAALLMFLVAAGLVAPVPAIAAKDSGLPPLLDRDLFFGDPEIAGAQISPDGKFISFIKPLDGVRNIWVKKTREPFAGARPLTADTKRPIPAYFWSRDSRYILFVQDDDGDENYNIHAVDPAAEPAQGKKVPASRELTAMEKVRAAIYAVPRKDPGTIYIGLNDRDAAWHDLYRLDLATGQRTLMRENTERIASWFFDNDGKLRLALRIADNGDTEILRVDEEGFTKVYSCDVFESCGPVRFHKDNKRFYLETNKGEGVDLTRLVLFDPATGKEELVESDPEGRVDFGNAIFSEVTEELVGTTYNDDGQRIYWRDKAFEKDYNWLKDKLPGMEIRPGSSTADERLWLIVASSDVEPGERHLFDRKKKKLTLQYRIFEDLPRKHLARMEPIRYKSSDGLEVPAYLTLPKGVPAKNLPLMIFPHGGPWARDGWGYDPLAQFLANRGYAVLQPNFRGSTGYGKAFLNAGNNEWGQKMQDDLTWGVKHLVSQGIADPERVGIMGGSYGGYATLAGVAFTPDVYAAAVSIVGPSNLITLLDSIPPYWESIRKMFHVRMGDPTTPEGKAQLERQSPLNSANKIKTPLLVVQGANDPRVKQAESDQIVVALRERKFPVEYLVADNEGHGFSHPVNNLAMFATAEKFLAKHLGGRAQEGVSEEVAQRLAELTVDVRTVTLAEKVDASSVGVPKATSGLVERASSYKAVIEAGGQTINLTMEREIRADDAGWVITESMQTPMGNAQDQATLARDTLVLLSRQVKQGPVTIDVAFKDNKASGTMVMNDNSRPIDVALGGAVFADGPGASEVLAALPLEKGYTATYRNFDLQAQKEKLKKLEVVGLETVTVEAGTFEAWRVDISSAEGDPDKASFWIDKETRRVVKATAVLPQMGGAVLTSELVSTRASK